LNDKAVGINPTSDSPLTIRISNKEQGILNDEVVESILLAIHDLPLAAHDSLLTN